MPPKKKPNQLSADDLFSLIYSVPSSGSEDSAEESDEDESNISIQNDALLVPEAPVNTQLEVQKDHANFSFDINSALDTMQNIDLENEGQYVADLSCVNSDSDDSQDGNYQPSKTSDEGESDFETDDEIPASDSEESEWKKDVISHDVPSFDKHIKTKYPFSQRDQPVAYFSQLFTNNLITNIVMQSNTYAKQNGIQFFNDTNITEMKAFFGLLVLMGVNPLPSVDLYWSSDPLFHNNEISKVMPIKRFKKILQCLHLNDNKSMPEKGSENYDRIYKIRPLHDGLRASFQEAVENSSSQSIDECMVKFKGRSSLKQYMPLKPIKRGFKIWARADSETGYLYDFRLYTGKEVDGSAVDNLGYKVVKTFAKDLPENSLLTFDNFFTSYKLMQDLYVQKIFSIGTVRTNRIDLPVLMKKKLKLYRGENRWRKRENTVAFVWQDSKAVTLLSTAHKGDDIHEIKRKLKDGSSQIVDCPQAIIDYTRTMGGVDHFDHLRATYVVGRRSKRWWLRLFYFLLDAAVTNAYILYMILRDKSKGSHMSFRLKLARALIADYNNANPRKRKSDAHLFPRRGKQTIPDELRLGQVGVHLPTSLSTYRRCRFCSTKQNDKRSKIKCDKCGVPLCATPCFKNFHM